MTSGSCCFTVAEISTSFFYHQLVENISEVKCSSHFFTKALKCTEVLVKKSQLFQCLGY